MGCTCQRRGCGYKRVQSNMIGLHRCAYNGETWIWRRGRGKWGSDFTVWRGVRFCRGWHSSNTWGVSWIKHMTTGWRYSGMPSGRGGSGEYWEIFCEGKGWIPKCRRCYIGLWYRWCLSLDQIIGSCCQQWRKLWKGRTPISCAKSWGSGHAITQVGRG